MEMVKNVPYVEVTQVVLIHCNVVNNSYQQNLGALYTFVPNKSFCKLLDSSPQNFKFLKTSNSECLYIEVWFTDEDSNSTEIKEKINITSINYSNTLFSSARDQIFVKGYGFLSFAKNMGIRIGKNISKNLNSKYSKKLIDHAKQSITDALKTASKRAIQKTAEATGDLIGNKIVDKTPPKISQTNEKKILSEEDLYLEN